MSRTDRGTFIYDVHNMLLFYDPHPLCLKNLYAFCLQIGSISWPLSVTTSYIEAPYSRKMAEFEELWVDLAKSFPMTLTESRPSLFRPIVCVLLLCCANMEWVLGFISSLFAQSLEALSNGLSFLVSTKWIVRGRKGTLCQKTQKLRGVKDPSKVERRLERQYLTLQVP